MVYGDSVYVITCCITTFVNITPDNLGLGGVYMFTSDVIGLDSDVILLGSLIIKQYH